LTATPGPMRELCRAKRLSRRRGGMLRVQSSCCFAQRRSRARARWVPKDAIFCIEIAPEVGCRIPFHSVSSRTPSTCPQVDYPHKLAKLAQSYKVSASVQGPQQASKGHRVFPVAFCPMLSGGMMIELIVESCFRGITGPWYRPTNALKCHLRSYSCSEDSKRCMVQFDVYGCRARTVILT